MVREAAAKRVPGKQAGTFDHDGRRTGRRHGGSQPFRRGAPPVFGQPALASADAAQQPPLEQRDLLGLRARAAATAVGAEGGPRGSRVAW